MRIFRFKLHFTFIVIFIYIKIYVIYLHQKLSEKKKATSLGPFLVMRVFQSLDEFATTSQHDINKYVHRHDRLKQFTVVSETQPSLLLKHCCTYSKGSVYPFAWLVSFLYRLFALIKRKVTPPDSRQLEIIIYGSFFWQRVPSGNKQRNCSPVIPAE